VSRVTSPVSWTGFRPRVVEPCFYTVQYTAMLLLLNCLHVFLGRSLYVCEWPKHFCYLKASRAHVHCARL